MFPHGHGFTIAKDCRRYTGPTPTAHTRSNQCFGFRISSIYTIQLLLYLIHYIGIDSIRYEPYSTTIGADQYPILTPKQKHIKLGMALHRLI